MRPRTAYLGFPFALLVCTVALFAIFKWQIIGPSRSEDFFVGLTLETCAWGGLWWLTESIRRRGSRAAALCANVLFYGVFYFSAGLIFAYTFFFDSAVERRFSLLDINFGGMGYFLTNVLPPNGWATLLGIAAGSHLGAFWLRRVPWEVPLRPAGLALLGLLIGSGLLAWSADRIATPLYDIGHDFAELALTPRIEILPTTRPYRSISSLDKSGRVPATLDTPFKKVLVLVMETMTSEKLAREAAVLPDSTFFKRERQRIHRFGHYFPNNQDSRTGMLDIVGSRLIPYEAYSDQDLASYQHVRTQPSLVDRFKTFGYATAFAVSQTDLEPVITELPWDDIVKLSDADIDEAKKSKQLCFTPYEFEHSCEDLVLLPKVVDFIAAHERVFLFQEFIWGHAYEYNEASGKSNADYYSAYIDRLIEQLEARGLMDDTLLAITSDHGFRDKGLQGELSVYRIPLMFYAKRFREHSDTRLLSHLDFKDLLFNELSPGSVQVDDNAFVLIVGPTGTGMTAALTGQHDFMLVKARGRDTRLLLEHKNVGVSGDARDAPIEKGAEAQLFKLFDDYRAEFTKQAQRVAH
jgi:hypothetical protein